MELSMSLLQLNYYILFIIPINFVIVYTVF